MTTRPVVRLWPVISALLWFNTGQCANLSEYDFWIGTGEFEPKALVRVSVRGSHGNSTQFSPVNIVSRTISGTRKWVNTKLKMDSVGDQVTHLQFSLSRNSRWTFIYAELSYQDNQYLCQPGPGGIYPWYGPIEITSTATIPCRCVGGKCKVVEVKTWPEGLKCNSTSAGTGSEMYNIMVYAVLPTTKFYLCICIEGKGNLSTTYTRVRSQVHTNKALKDVGPGIARIHLEPRSPLPFRFVDMYYKHALIRCSAGPEGVSQPYGMINIRPGQHAVFPCMCLVNCGNMLRGNDEGGAAAPTSLCNLVMIMTIFCLQLRWILCC